MFGFPIAFASPWILLTLISLPVIWWLLRLTPPRPQEETFPPTRILARLTRREETPAQSPWWLTLLRLAMAALVILAMAGPLLNPEKSGLAGDGPVMIIADDGWASGSHWKEFQVTALAIVEQAEQQGRPLILHSTTGRKGWEGTTISANEARGLIQASTAEPLLLDHEAVRNRIEAQKDGINIGQIHWLSDGLARAQTQDLADTLSKASDNLAIYLNSESEPLSIGRVRNEPGEMIGTIARANGNVAARYDIAAHDEEGIVIARSTTTFLPGEKEADFTFDHPVELRNQITKLSVVGAENAGAVKLLDENNRRRLVGLISGATFDRSQPLLSPLYYISKALEPFSDIRRSDDANIAAAVPDLVNQGVSVIMLADVGTLPDQAEEALSKWVEKGGMLVRFAGPRLGASPQGGLLPVEIRPGDRNLGGALSWETPKPLAIFERESPFFGLEPPRNVLVNKQLLALQETELDEKTWARLEDGTPLVTADKRAAGWIVLFHVGSDADWSNLPLSGTFVEMLRRTVNLSSASSSTAGNGDAELVLPPLRMLDATGKFVQPNEETEPLTIKADTAPLVTSANPPGFYGTEDGIRALNLFTETPELRSLAQTDIVGDIEQRSFITGNELQLKNWLLAAAAILLILDSIAVLWMSGTLKSFFSRFKAGAVISVIAVLGLVFALASTPSTLAQQIDETGFDYSAAMQTRLAYVLTGVAEVDRISEAGMRGLTHFISSRTALEPGEPVGLDVSQDELSFYSLIYWPVDPRAEIPDDATMARVDAFMKQGGSVLFDTRDQISGILGGTADSPAAMSLQAILSGLDIPSLEPVPTDHVLTKSFYLLDRFPGRFNGGDLWVEASQRTIEEEEGRPARAGDGVSSILITSNDLAGAWAVDAELRPLLPTVPPDAAQRNYAFRSGVNLMMYALTGNYKADQVHLPALLERLGQ